MEDYRDADFWLTKGIQTTYSNNLSTAIQCYKQCLLLNEEHYVAMFNIAAVYERFNKFTCAFKWFKRTVQVESSMNEAHMGAALNLFKLGKFELAATFVEEAIAVLEDLKREKEGGRIDTVELED